MSPGFELRERWSRSCDEGLDRRAVDRGDDVARREAGGAGGRAAGHRRVVDPHAAGGDLDVARRAPSRPRRRPCAASRSSRRGRPCPAPPASRRAESARVLGHELGVVVAQERQPRLEPRGAALGDGGEQEAGAARRGGSADSPATFTTGATGCAGDGRNRKSLGRRCGSQQRERDAGEYRQRAARGRALGEGSSHEPHDSRRAERGDRLQ